MYAIGNSFARAYFIEVEVDLRVESSLKSRHFTFDDVFDFVRQLRFHVLLQSTEKERAKDFVQTSNDQNSFFLVQLDLNLRRKFKNKIKSAKKCLHGGMHAEVESLRARFPGIWTGPL